LILLRADAGEVVRAFGSFVVSGNPLVGGVIFLILTIVQFIVIAKGSERVAEVTARFTLDALPGKQMSIDADLRSGAIDQQEAGRRRFQLEREAQFHGSMDGAMKFVKGDAVAGMVITAVNILGGLLVGTLQRGLSAGQAAETYTVLTIGDGLVSQIPALLISTAAGLVVTRVRAERPNNTLGKQVFQQVGAHPEILLLSGGVLALLGLVPGMPTLSFCVLGVILTGLGLGALRHANKSRRADTLENNSDSACSVVLQLGESSSLTSGLGDYLDQMRLQVQQDLGIAIAVIEPIQAGSRGRWTLLADQVPIASGSTKISRPDLAREVGRALRKSAARFVGVQETQDMLDRLERSQPALVREVVPRLVPPVLLSEILGRLVEEQVPVRNMRGILATLAEWARSEADPAALAERVREAHGAIISHQVAPDGCLKTLLLDPTVEQLLQGALNHTANGTTLTLAPDDGQAILQGLDQAVQQMEDQVVVLTRPEFRRPFWKLICSTHPTVRVVSFLELDPATAVQPAGKIALNAA
jgi:type III secretion protein V